MTNTFIAKPIECEGIQYDKNHAEILEFVGYHGYLSHPLDHLFIEVNGISQVVQRGHWVIKENEKLSVLTDTEFDRLWGREL